MFINDERQEHVTSKDLVTAGKWFYDYDLNRVYLAENTLGKKVELSFADHAFGPAIGGGNDNVTIKNLQFEKFANVAQRGVIRGNIAGTNNNSYGWIV